MVRPLLQTLLSENDIKERKDPTLGSVNEQSTRWNYKKNYNTEIYKVVILTKKCFTRKNIYETTGEKVLSEG